MEKVPAGISTIGSAEPFTAGAPRSVLLAQPAKPTARAKSAQLRRPNISDSCFPLRKFAARNPKRQDGQRGIPVSAFGFDDADLRDRSMVSALVTGGVSHRLLRPGADF